MAKNPKLWGEALRAAARPWREELGRSDRDRLDALLGLSVRAEIALSDCLTALFLGMSTDKAQPAMAAFRKRLNDAASELGLCFHVDTKKKSRPAERRCWFTGPDPTMARVESFSRQLTNDIQDQPLIRSKGIATSETAPISGKRPVWFFVSSARKDEPYVKPIMEQLRTEFASSRRYDFKSWMGEEILVGDQWRQRIQQAVEHCQFGLLFLSPAFLESDSIEKEELPYFVGTSKDSSTKPVIPVGLTRVSFERQDLKGLEEYQLFLLRGPRNEGRFFRELTTLPNKQKFVHQLYVAIENRLEASVSFAPDSPGPHSPSRGKEPSTAANLVDRVQVPENTEHFQRPRGQRINLGEMERLDRPIHKTASLEQGSDALDELRAWAINPEAPPFFALLGEYGIGKTTTLKQFTRLLLEERQSTPGMPLPIYVDLRDYIGESRDDVPTIEKLLAGIIERSWKLQDRSLTPQDLLRMIREEGALIIFDGLDEKIVHLPPGRAREFIRTLWSVLPDATGSALEGRRSGKLLLSCRAHYFRDIWTQNSMLVGEDREGLDRQRFPSLCLLPFTEPQILAYLKSLLGEESSANRAFEVIASIHNLRDLAQRPYLLSLIGVQLGALEEFRARGKPVNAARLYELVVRSWLGRDDGKHQIDSAHKIRLMEDLAAALWREDRRQWDADRLEDWLDETITSNPTFAKIYAHKDHAVLKEDLRTATFVLRGTREEKHFRFAHASLQEYFLAAHLLRALVDGRPEPWDLPRVSRETLDFLGDMLSSSDIQSAALRTLERLLEGERPRAAVLAFAYWLRALERSFPVPSPRRVKLAGADLNEWDVRGRGPTQPLNLRGADLSGARLNRARVEFVDLTEADLTDSQARQALFMKVSASRLKAAGSDWSGLKWREGSLVGARLNDIQLDGCQWIRVGLDGALLPEGWAHRAASVAGRRSPTPLPTGAMTLSPNVGHSGWVNACAWSPDGQRFVSGSDDGSLKVWDATSGDCLLTMTVPGAAVMACGWSPDGRLLVSGCRDGSLKVWNATSGDCVRKMAGQRADVLVCAWSPDGQRLVSGLGNGTVEVWDTASGDCLLTVPGMGSPIHSCAWSPDGQRLLVGGDGPLRVLDVKLGTYPLTPSLSNISVYTCDWSPDGQRFVSGSEDRMFRVWDALTGDCLLKFPNPDSDILTCVWSPDGQRFVSISDQGLLKVWDATSGACLLTLVNSFTTVMACAWSPDGRRLLSGSGDRALRVWDATSGVCLLTLPGLGTPVGACEWSPDGQRLVLGSDDGVIRVWDALSGVCLRTLPGPSVHVRVCVWSPDGQRLVSGAFDGALKVWDAVSGTCLLTLPNLSAAVRACAWSPNGQRFVSGSGDGVLKVWDAASGACLLTPSQSGAPVYACAWSPDGQHLVSGDSAGVLKIWDATSGSFLRELPNWGPSVRACAWSPDGQRIVSGAFDGMLKVWDAALGICLQEFCSSEDVSVKACAWSPDGQRIVSGSDDGALKVWDAASGTLLFALSETGSPVRSCAWSPDGTRIASGSFDGALKVWNLSSRLCAWSGQMLPDHQFASLDVVGGRVLHASSEAWRWLCWRWADPSTGRLRLLPAEAMGPLPVESNPPS